MAGLFNEEIALRLDISAKTVKNHRAWVMERIGARNLADLVRMAMQARGRRRPRAGRLPGTVAEGLVLHNRDAP